MSGRGAPRKLSPQRAAEVVRQYQAGLPSTELSRTFGVTDGVIFRALRAHGVPSRDGHVRKFTPEQEAEVCRRYLAGEGTTLLARSFGVTAATVMSCLHRNDVRMRGLLDRSNQRLDPKVAAAAAALYQSGMSAEVVGAKLDISHALVCKAVRRSGAAVRPAVKPRVLTPEQEAEICLLYQKGETLLALAQRFGLKDKSIVARTLKRQGVKARIGWAKYRTVEWTDVRGRLFTFKSSWEMAYAKHLDAQGARWDYEPISYLLVDCRRYTPDFAVYGEDGKLLRLVEVHGWPDAPTARRLREFVQNYPDLPLEILGPAEMAAMKLVPSKYATDRQGAGVTALRRELAAKEA